MGGDASCKRCGTPGEASQTGASHKGPENYANAHAKVHQWQSITCGRAPHLRLLLSLLLLELCQLVVQPPQLACRGQAGEGQQQSSCRSRHSI